MSTHSPLAIDCVKAMLKLIYTHPSGVKTQTLDAIKGVLNDESLMNALIDEENKIKSNTLKSSSSHLSTSGSSASHLSASGSSSFDLQDGFSHSHDDSTIIIHHADLVYGAKIDFNPEFMPYDIENIETILSNAINKDNKYKKRKDNSLTAATNIKLVIDHQGMECAHNEVYECECTTHRFIITPKETTGYTLQDLCDAIHHISLFTGQTEDTDYICEIVVTDGKLSYKCSNTSLIGSTDS